MDNESNLNMGRGYSPSVTYTHCNNTAPRRPGQVGGVAYGYTKEGSRFNADIRGTRPVMTKLEKNKQCGGPKSGCYQYHRDGRLSRKRGGRKKFRKHYMWNKKGKKYRVKTYKQHLKGVRLGHTHKKPKKNRKRKSRKS